MTDLPQTPVQRALAKWQEAEDAYHDESQRYISVGWGDSGTLEMPGKALVPEGLAELKALRKVADEAQAAYIEAIGRA